MPLIRYRTGDLGAVEQADDEVAGRIVGLVGRVHDWVPIAGRRYPSHYLQDVLDRLGCVDEFQVQLRGSAPPLLRLVVERKGERERVRAALREQWGDALEIAFGEVASLVRQGWRDKFNRVVEEA